MSTVKVLEVIRQGQVGGGESHLVDLVTGFSPEIEPVILAFSSGQMIDKLRNEGIRCYVIETKNAFDFTIQQKLRQIIKQENIKIIHAHGSRAASNMVFLSKLIGIPMVYTVHGWSFHQDQSPAIKQLRIFSEKILCAMSSQVICVSESNRSTGKDAFGLNNAVVIENGIDLTRFNVSNKFKDIRTEFGFSSQDFIVGFFGRMTIQKDPITFIKAIKEASSVNSNVKALLVGEGDLDREVAAAIIENNLQTIISRSPFRPDVPDLMSAIDVFCQPSLWEGLSIALIEAMAMKKAVLVTPADGTKEIIQNGFNGSVIGYKDFNSLAEKIINYSTNSQLLSKHGENAFNLVKDRFDAERVSERVADIYRNI